MQVIIMQGIPGSGKSTLALKLMQEARDEGRRAFIVSADHYFETRRGEYNFDPKLLPIAHSECLKAFITAVRDWRVDLLIVDNTNTQIEGIAPYYAIAEAFWAEVKILRVTCDPHVATARNVHKVPESTVLAMHFRINTTAWPARWKFEHAAEKGSAK